MLGETQDRDGLKFCSLCGMTCGIPMSDEQAKPIDTKTVAPYIQRLEQELAAINAPLHVHQAQKQILAGFWGALQKHGQPASPPPPVLPVKNEKKAK